MSLLGRTLVTVALVQEKYNQQKYEHGDDVEWRKEGLGASLLESGFDADLARHIDDGRDGWKVHLLPKKDVFSTGNERAGQTLHQNDLGRRTLLDSRDVQSSRPTA